MKLIELPCIFVDKQDIDFESLNIPHEKVISVSPVTLDAEKICSFHTSDNPGRSILRIEFEACGYIVNLPYTELKKKVLGVLEKG